jgi:hypothetical protein
MLDRFRDIGADDRFDNLGISLRREPPDYEGHEEYMILVEVGPAPNLALFAALHDFALTHGLTATLTSDAVVLRENSSGVEQEQ